MDITLSTQALRVLMNIRRGNLLMEISYQCMWLTQSNQTRLSKRVLGNQIIKGRALLRQVLLYYTILSLQHSTLIVPHTFIWTVSEIT